MKLVLIVSKTIIYEKEIESLKMSYLFDFIIVQVQIIFLPQKTTLGK